MSSSINFLIDWFNDVIISYENDKKILSEKYDYFIKKWNYYIQELDPKEQKAYSRIKKNIDKRLKMKLK